MKLSLFYQRKEAVILYGGLVAIAAIMVFYGGNFLRQSFTPDKNANKSLEMAVIPEEAWISPEDLTEKLRKNQPKIALIDIRENNLFASEHIPLSLNISPENISSFVPQADTETIIISSVGNETETNAYAFWSLKKSDEEARIFILRGGFEGWYDNGGEFLSFGNPESVVNQAQVTYITPENLSESFKTIPNLLLLDMRSPELYAKEHLPKAKNLPLGDLERRYKSIPTGALLVVYADSELADFQAGVRLFDLGFFSTKVLKGGIEEWKNKNLPLEK